MAGKKRMTAVKDEPKEAKPKVKTEMSEQEITNFLARMNGGHLSVRYGDKGCLCIFQQGIVEVKQKGDPPQLVEAVITQGRLARTPQGWVFRSPKGVFLPVFALFSD